MSSSTIGLILFCWRFYIDNPYLNAITDLLNVSEKKAQIPYIEKRRILFIRKAKMSLLFDMIYSSEGRSDNHPGSDYSS